MSLTTIGHHEVEQQNLQHCSHLQIPGNFHVATHSADKQPDAYDFTHEIHEVSFGSKIRAISAKGIGTFNSLGGVEHLESHGLGKLPILPSSLL